MRNLITAATLTLVASTAFAAPDPTDPAVRDQARLIHVEHAVLPGLQPVCELDDYACVEYMDLEGFFRTACGNVTIDPANVDPPAFRLTTDQDCLDQGGTICSYPWDNRHYCCDIQLGAPPLIGV